MKRFIVLFLCLSMLWMPVQATEQEKLVCLTFDDGPSGRFTQRLLEGLAQRNVKATFLLCGYRMEQYPALTEEIFRQGHEIGLHGYSHKSLQNTCREGADREIQKAMKLIPEGCNITFFRSPGGLCSKEVSEAAKDWGLSMLLWSVDPKDWAIHDASIVSKTVIDRVRDGDVILLHDMTDSSVDAAFAIIDKLQTQGYRFVTASELALEKGITPSPGVEYRRFGP